VTGGKIRNSNNKKKRIGGKRESFLLLIWGRGGGEGKAADSHDSGIALATGGKGLRWKEEKERQEGKRGGTALVSFAISTKTTKRREIPGDRPAYGNYGEKRAGRKKKGLALPECLGRQGEGGGDECGGNGRLKARHRRAGGGGMKGISGLLSCRKHGGERGLAVRRRGGEDECFWLFRGGRREKGKKSIAIIRCPSRGDGIWEEHEQKKRELRSSPAHGVPMKGRASLFHSLPPKS